MEWMKKWVLKAYYKIKGSPKKPSRSREGTQPTRSNGGVRELHPLAQFRTDMPFMVTPNKFKFDEDHAFVLHYTAGHQSRKAKDFIRSFIDKGLATYFIDHKGELWQQFHGDRSGWHAGRKSVFPQRCKLRGKKISNRAAGVEVACAGKLERRNGKWVSWFNKVIPDDQVRVINDEDLRMGYKFKGGYQKYTEAQEKTIAELMAWHVAKGLPYENLVGHDEIARPIGRKTDPSGSLSMPLSMFIHAKVLPLVDKYKEDN